MRHNDVAMFLQNRQGDEDVKVAAQVIRPETLPESKYVGPFKLPLIPDEKHAEEEKEVGGIGRL